MVPFNKKSDTPAAAPGRGRFSAPMARLRRAAKSMRKAASHLRASRRIKLF